MNKRLILSWFLAVVFMFVQGCARTDCTLLASGNYVAGGSEGCEVGK